MLKEKMKTMQDALRRDKSGSHGDSSVESDSGETAKIEDISPSTKPTEGANTPENDDPLQETSPRKNQASLETIDPSAMSSDSGCTAERKQSEKYDAPSGISASGWSQSVVQESDEDALLSGKKKPTRTSPGSRLSGRKTSSASRDDDYPITTPSPRRKTSKASGLALEKGTEENKGSVQDPENLT